MDRPVASDVRSWAPPQFNWTAAGYPPGEDPDPLEIRVIWAWAELLGMTGRSADSIASEADEALAQKGTTLLVLQEAMGGSAAALNVMQAPWLRSFTAGSYSETRFSPAELAGNGKAADVISKLHPWPALARVLWLLATPEKREEWLELYSGQVRVAADIVEHDWGEGEASLWPGTRGWPS